jgi:hypothetical protein
MTCQQTYPLIGVSRIPCFAVCAMRERMQETRKPNSNGEILGHSLMIIHDKSTKYLKGKKKLLQHNERQQQFRIFSCKFKYSTFHLNLD